MAKTTTPGPTDQQAAWIPPRGLPPADQQIRKLGAHDFLPPQLQELSKTYETFGHQLMEKLPDHPARTEALKALVRSREMAIEALLPR